MPERVEVAGEAGPGAARSASAGKLVLGRVALDAAHVSTLREVLRRDPAVSVSAGGRIGLLGLPGYTQVLLDGQAPPDGLDPFELPPAQVERVEIIRGTLAESGLAGVAGTINVVRRSLKRGLPWQWSGELSGPAAQRTVRFGAQGAWRDDAAGHTAGLTVNAWRTRSVLLSEQSGLALATPTVEDWRSSATNVVLHTQVAVSPSLRLKLADGESLQLSADLSSGTSGNVQDTVLAPGSRTASAPAPQSRYRWNWRTSPSLTGTLEWERRLEGGAVWTARGQVARMRESMDVDGSAQWADGSMQALANRDDRQRTSSQWRWVRREAARDGHALQWGADLRHERLDQSRGVDVDGARSYIDELFTSKAVSRNLDRSLWVEDDWAWSDELNLKLGLRYEQRTHRLTEGVARHEVSLQMLAPSVHAAWNLGEDGEHVLSVGVSRGFNMPLATVLSARPVLDPTTECRSRLRCGSNRPLAPDRAGNPLLQPERSWGLDLNLEASVAEHSTASLGWGGRWMDAVRVQSTALESVPWSSEARWVERPTNAGRARSRAVTLGFSLTPADWWAASPSSLELTGSLQWASSSVSAVRGPDNRLPEQSPRSARWGAKVLLSPWPLEWRVDGSLHPAYAWQDAAGLVRREGPKRVWSTSATWTFDATTQLTVQISPLRPDVHTTQSIWPQSAERWDQRNRARPVFSLSWNAQLSR